MDGGSGAARAVAVAERRRRKAGGRGEVATAGRLRQCFSLGLFVLPWCFRFLFFLLFFVIRIFLLCLFFSFYLFLFFFLFYLLFRHYIHYHLCPFSLNSNIFFPSAQYLFVYLTLSSFLRSFSPLFLSAILFTVLIFIYF